MPLAPIHGEQPRRLMLLLVGTGLFLLASLALLATLRLRKEGNPAWAEISRQRLQVEAELKRFVESQKDQIPQTCSPACDHPQTPELWQALRTRDSSRALAIAEQAVSEASANPQARLLLSMALLSRRDLDAAAAQLATAVELGARDALADYLGAKIEIEQYLDSITGGSRDSTNAILMPVEILAIELHVRFNTAGDTSALWLPGHDKELSQEEAREFVVAHFTDYYRLLSSTLASLGTEVYADGVYHLARLAFKCGFSEEGSALLLPLEEVMKNSAVHSDYRRDLALLQGKRSVVSESTGKGGKQVIKLNVLS